ncbi:Ankyrin repeat-containing domain protein [Rhypophila decipiens]
MPQLGDLPPELVTMIAECLDSRRDLSSLSRVCRGFFSLLRDDLYRAWHRGLPERDLYFLEARDCVLAAFYHAIKHDSTNIVSRLLVNDFEDLLDLKGHMLEHDETYINASASNRLTFLDFALLGDAPTVAVHLKRHGARMDQIARGPRAHDLTHLLSTLEKSQTSSQGELDASLRTASSYALPRITRLLLEMGADQFRIHRGLAPIHIALARRHPWEEAPAEVYAYMDTVFGSMIAQTVTELLKAGVNCELRTETSRFHECNHSCWKSRKCGHRGQTALHFACGGGFHEAVSLLLQYGADPSSSNLDGYTPLYYALVQGYKITARTLLAAVTPKNPIVYVPHNTTALHVACRYAFSSMAKVLLEAGADPNVGDINGRTPLHEALSLTSPDTHFLERQLIKTLNLPKRYGANPDIEPYPKSPAVMGRWHPLRRVQDMFRPGYGTAWSATTQPPDINDNDQFPALTPAANLSTTHPAHASEVRTSERTNSVIRGPSSAPHHTSPPIHVPSETDPSPDPAALPSLETTIQQDEAEDDSEKKDNQARKGKKKWKLLSLD